MKFYIRISCCIKYVARSLGHAAQSGWGRREEQSTAPACISLEFAHRITPVGKSHAPDTTSLRSGWVGVPEQRLKKWWEV